MSAATTLHVDAPELPPSSGPLVQARLIGAGRLVPAEFVTPRAVDLGPCLRLLGSPAERAAHARDVARGPHGYMQRELPPDDARGVRR